MTESWWEDKELTPRSKFDKSLNNGKIYIRNQSLTNLRCTMTTATPPMTPPEVPAAHIQPATKAKIGAGDCVLTHEGKYAVVLHTGYTEKSSAIQTLYLDDHIPFGIDLAGCTKVDWSEVDEDVRQGLVDLRCTFDCTSSPGGRASGKIKSQQIKDGRLLVSVCMAKGMPPWPDCPIEQVAITGRGK